VSYPRAVRDSFLYHLQTTAHQEATACHSGRPHSTRHRSAPSSIPWLNGRQFPWDSSRPRAQTSVLSGTRKYKPALQQNPQHRTAADHVVNHQRGWPPTVAEVTVNRWRITGSSAGPGDHPSGPSTHTHTHAHTHTLAREPTNDHCWLVGTRHGHSGSVSTRNTSSGQRAIEKRQHQKALIVS